MTRTVRVASVVVSTALVAGLDFSTSADLVGSILFAVPLALCAMQHSKALLWGTAAATALLTIAAEWWGFPRGPLLDPFTASANRALLLVSLLALTAFIHAWIDNTQKIKLDAAEIERQRSSLTTQNVQLAGLVSAAKREIRVREVAEKHLVQMEARNRALLEAAPSAMVVVDHLGKILLLNLQTQKQFGYSRDELLGKQLTSIIPGAIRERLLANVSVSAAEAVAQQGSIAVEVNGRRKSGSEFPIEVMISPLESDEGLLVIVAVRDISVRKTAELLLAQMEAKYHGLLEAAPDAMVVVNERGEIVLLNVQAEKQFGYRRDELVGQAVNTIIPEGFAERLIADRQRSAEDALAQQIGSGLELIGHRKDGSHFPIEIMLSPLASPEGILVTAAIRDITTRKKAEAHLKVEADLLAKMEELNRSNEELSQFAYIASHDLQEPLRMVASYTQLISKRYKGKLDSDADEFIAFAVDGANRMQRLIQDLLIYSRVGTERAPLQDASSEDALERALLNLSGAIETSGARVTHDSLPIVRADAGQLVQLFQNLVGNAIKYQHGGEPHVHIAAVKGAHRRWAFSVTDNGLGIAPQYFDKIFGMFQRLHKRDEFAGTGIGLAVCKKIIERHGGKISVESQLGQGSTFRFALAGSEHMS